jgi:uncharacterized protein (DUF697 family)
MGRQSQREEMGMSEKQPLALGTVKRYMWLSGAAGLVPVPLADLVAVSGVQLKMLADISKIYGVPFHANRGKMAIASTMGYVLPHALSYGLIGSLIKGIPLVGTLAGDPAMALFSAASAWALGTVFIQHFESGGTFLNFDAEAVKEYYREQFASGRKMASNQKGEEKAPA